MLEHARVNPPHRQRPRSAPCSPPVAASALPRPASTASCAPPLRPRVRVRRPSGRARSCRWRAVALSLCITLSHAAIAARACSTSGAVAVQPSKPRFELYGFGLVRIPQHHAHVFDRELLARLLALFEQLRDALVTPVRCASVVEERILEARWMDVVVRRRDPSAFGIQLLGRSSLRRPSHSYAPVPARAGGRSSRAASVPRR